MKAFGVKAKSNRPRNILSAAKEGSCEAPVELDEVDSTELEGAFAGNFVVDVTNGY
jgi:hypothetical protein